MMTCYERRLARHLGLRLGTTDSARVVEYLARRGLLDYRACKIFTVREFLQKLIRGGVSTTEALWQASERFACTYEYARRCLYDYRDMNL